MPLQPSTQSWRVIWVRDGISPSSASDNDRQRRELVANLAHEFRTPLTSLSGYTRQLLRTASVADSRENPEAIRLNVDRLTRLAAQLPRMSHANIADRPLTLESFSFAELADDIVTKFRPRAEENDIILSVENEADMAQVAADVELIDHARPIWSTMPCSPPMPGDKSRSASSTWMPTPSRSAFATPASA